MSSGKKYCLDTNVFIEGWNKYYSIDLSPSYWDILDKLAQDGRVFAPIEVKREIKTIEDQLFDWVKKRPHLFREITPEIQEQLRYIMAKYGRLVDSTRQRSIADPWVIAFAAAEQAVVVTKEELSASNKRIKIPDVCQEMGIEWINDFEFAKQVGIRFDAHLITNC